MRSTPLTVVALFLLSALAGWAARELSARPGADEEARLLPPGRMSATLQREEPPPHTPEDLQKWAKEHAPGMVREGYDFFPRVDLAAWTEEELRAALNKGLRDPAATSYGGSTRAMVALLKEWTGRNPEAAWAYLLGIPVQSMRWRLSPGIADGWPADRAEEGWALVVANPEVFENPHGYAYAGLLNHACEAAAKRGPEAVAALIAQVKEHRLQMPFEGLKFPADFDFATLAARSETVYQGRNGSIVPGFLVDAWMRQDPDAAFDGLLSLSRAGSADLAWSLAVGLERKNLLEPELMSDRTTRIVAKLSALEPGERQAVNEAVVQNLAQVPEQLKRFCASYADPALRAEAAFQAARPCFDRSPDEAMAFVELSPALGDRMANLERLWPERGSRPGPYLESYFKKRLESWGVSPEAATQWLELVKTEEHP